MTTTTTAPLRYIGKCPQGHGNRYDADAVFANRSRGIGDILVCTACRMAVKVRAIAGRVTEQPCGARCLGAVGPACDCQCGGENHGGGHA
jgi:hypothetical protein